MIDIAFENVAFTYDGKVNALDGVNLAIRAGEFVCLVGSNGSGKSTLAKHMNALIVPDSGTVTIDGIATNDKAGAYHARQNVGMVFQTPDDALVATLIEDDVAFGPQNIGIAPEEIRQRVTESLEIVGLGGYEKHDTVALSGGQKQRVAIAGVLAMKPRVIVFDEATAMLDPAGKEEILAVARNLHANGMTIVWVTHSMEEVALAATRVIALHNGVIAYDGKPFDLFANDDLVRQLNLRPTYAMRLVAALSSRGIDITPEERRDDGINPFASPESLADAITKTFVTQERAL